MRASFTLAACALALSGGLVRAEEFRIDRFFVIGDSLSDAGAFSQGVPVVSGLPNGIPYRFTTNALNGSSLVWSQHLAAALGLPPQTSDVLQGVPAAGIPTVDLNGGNYAEGGARVNDQPGVIGGLTPALGFTTLPGTTQIDRLLADSPRFSGSDLIAVWLGANDIFVQLGGLGFGLPPAVATANLQTAANQLVAQIDRLSAAGAKNIIVVTVPDIGTTPFGRSQADGGATLTALTNTFNAELLAGLRGRSAVVVDSGKLLSAVQANPARYGFTATNAATVPACADPPGSLFCIQGINASPDSELRVFADGVHPTAAAHAIFGQAGFAGLQAGAQTGTIAVAALSAVRQQAIGLESRLNPTAFGRTDEDGKSGRRPVGHVEKFGSIEGGYYEASAEQVRPGITAYTEVIKAGSDIIVAPNALVGAGVSLDHGQLEFAGDRGGFDSRLYIGAVYGTLALTPGFYINASGAAGYIDLYDVERSFALGPARESYSASSDGYYVSARIGTGILGRFGNWVVNPAASITHERVKINGFTESAGAASLAFGDQEFFVTRLSGSVTTTYVPDDALAWRGSLRVSVEHDLEDANLTIQLGPTSNNLGFVTAPRPDSTFGFVSGQLIKPLPGDAAFIVSGSGVVGFQGQQGYTGTLTYKKSF